MVKKIMLNQVGYINKMPKIAYLTGSADYFQIVRAKGGKTVFSGT